MGITLSGSALLLALAIAAPARAEPDAGPPEDKPDAGAPLVVVPNSSGTTAEPQGERPGLPAPPALDSKRSPMPDRLANDHWLQYFPMAPPTPPVPTSTAGGGARRTSTIFGPVPANSKRPTGGAPPDIPRDSVTRTPEDMMAPPTPTSTP